MLDAGIELQSARKAVESLRSYKKDLASARIVIDGSTRHARRERRAGDGPHARRPGRVQRRRRCSRCSRQINEAVQLSFETTDRREPRHDREPVIETRTAPARAGALRAQLRAAVREAARLLRHRVGVRTAHVHARARPRRQTVAGVRARLLPAGVRPLHRDHDAQPEARDEEEPQGAPAGRVLSRRADPRALPARLPAPAREVRARAAVAARRRRGAGRRAAAAVRSRSPGAARGAAGSAAESA